VECVYICISVTAITNQEIRGRAEKRDGEGKKVKLFLSMPRRHIGVLEVHLY
jgi:hypothetical protein